MSMKGLYCKNDFSGALETLCMNTKSIPCYSEFSEKCTSINESSQTFSEPTVGASSSASISYILGPKVWVFTDNWESGCRNSCAEIRNGF